MGGGGDGYKVQDEGRIKNKTDRCMMEEVDARVASVPPSTQHQPLGGDGGVGFGGEPPAPLG